MDAGRGRDPPPGDGRGAARLIEVQRQADAAPVDRVIVVNAVDVTPEPQDAR